MRLSFYKPNPRNSGYGCSFQLASTTKEPEKLSFFISFIKQAGWDETNKKGSFSANMKNKDKTASVKLSDTEIAGMILALKDQAMPFSFIHRTAAATSNVFFKPYERDGKIVGMSLSASIAPKEGEKKNFLMGFNHNEAELLAIFLKKALENKLSGETTIEPE